jgi:hypothetical protein
LQDTTLVSNVTATSAHLTGDVHPNDYETHWRFEYATTETGPWLPGPEGTIPQAEAAYTEEGKTVEADLAGLSASTDYYVRLFAQNGHPPAATSNVLGFETAGPPLAETFAVHAIHGEVLRALGSLTPNGYDTHYRVQYVTQERFEQSGWAGAETTPELDAGEGTSHVEERLKEGKVSLRVFDPTFVGADIPGLQAGETYHYRLLASNEKGAVEGKEQALAVPATPEPTAAEPCPNEATRTGPSAHLPDCRAYEQITPVEKEGAQEPFSYVSVFGGGVLVGEDGEHFMLDQPSTDWGSGQSPYFFSRTPAGWQMTAGAPQPETGINSYEPQLVSPDLTQFGFSALWHTSRTGGERESPEVEFKLGPPGGHYATAASVPRSNVTSWVAASEDFGKLVLQTEDHSLLGSLTGTTSGADLYEYSQGQLHQTNVLGGGSPGSTIGSCGAKIARGQAEALTAGESSDSHSSPHAVSADGSRVFFEAIPSSNCSEPKHLYMRTGGSETRDIGEYTFLAANPSGSKLLLEKRSGETREFLLYDTEAAAAKPLFSAHQELVSTSLSVSEDLTAIYFQSTERLTPEAPAARFVPVGQALDLYRYDIPAKTLRFLVQDFGANSNNEQYGLSPDGRFYYFTAKRVAGLPGGATGTEGEFGGEFYRYDSAQDVVECVSCASPFDPEPKLALSPHLGNAATNGIVQNGVPKTTYVSANGDYAFFATPAALLPQDQNGELPPESYTCIEGCKERPSGTPSTDVYEWRKSGVDGCARLQGCISLITPGTDGYFVQLLGTTNSGRDVFFTTRSQLVPQDNDNSVDAYDARISGGFAPPTRPVECEGDACSTPFAAPNDLTPSSATFSGAGNVLGATLPEVKSKPKPKKKTKKKAKPKKKGKKSSRAKRPVHRHHGGVK